MALYRPDYTLIDAEKVIDTLDPKDPRDASILYYIADIKRESDKKEKRLDQYREFFKLLNELIPYRNSNPILR